MSMDSNIKDLSIRVAQEFERRPLLISNSGRFYCYFDDRWVTESNDVYGKNNFQFNENCGTNAEPRIKWQDNGILLGKGKKIKKLMFAGRANNQDLQDLELRVIVKYPTNASLWNTGINNNSQFQVQTLYSGNFKTAAMTGNMNTMMLREIDLGGYELPEHAMLCIYVKPVKSVFLTRYFFATYTFEIE